MTDRRSPTSDQLLVAWFEDGPTSMPDRVLDVVADRIGRQRQRRPWRLPWRLPMNTPLKLAAGLAAVIVLAVAGYSLLPKAVSGPGATPSIQPTTAPTPSIAAVATPTPTCDSAATCAAGVLAGGANHSSLFEPGFAFTVPGSPLGAPPATAWRNTQDWIDLYVLQAPSTGSPMSFSVHSLAAIPEQNSDCSHATKVGAGKAVADWIQFLTTHPGLVTSTPVAVTLLGATGFSIEFERSPTWTATCPGSLGPAIVTMTDDNAEQGKVYFTDDQKVSWTILDVGGETVIIRIDSGPTDEARISSLAIANPIIQTFDFTQ